MKEVNLNNIIALILLVLLGVWGVRQLLEKRELKNQLELKSVELSEVKKTSMDLLTKSERDMIDSIVFYKEKTNSLKEKTNTIKAKLIHQKKALQDSIYKLSTITSKLFIDSVFTPGGSDVCLTENQVKDIHISELKSKELELTSSFQQEAIKTLDSAYNNCYSSMVVIQDNLNECVDDLNKKESRIRSLRKKVWGSRIVGFVGVALSVLIIL